MNKKRKSVIILGLIVMLVLVTSVIIVNAQVWDNPSGKVNFSHTHNWPTLLDFPEDCPTGQFVSGVDDETLTCNTPAAGVDNDWTGAGSGQMYATSLTDKIGIGTNNPLAKLHINEGVSTTNQEVARITFSNNSPSIGVRGIRVVSTPLNAKGTQIGVEAQTSKTGGPDAQRGSAQASLSHISGFFLRGTFLGVQGIARPNVLDNYNHTATSHGLGGLFIAEPDSTLTLDNTGTYWVGGVYGEVAGTIDNTPASGAVAGVIGVDNADGTAESYAGYFDGRLRVTELPQDDNLNSVVVADADGVLHTRNANTLGGASGPDGDWQITGNDMVSIPSGNIGIGIAPDTKLTLFGDLTMAAGAINSRIRFKESSSNMFSIAYENAGSSPYNLLHITHDHPNGMGVGKIMTFTEWGNVGIGTTTPQSKLQVNGYVQLALTSGTPPSADCNSASEMGRMKVDDSGGGFLYVCTQTSSGIGWVAK